MFILPQNFIFIRTSTFLDVLRKTTIEIVCITPKLRNCCYRLFRTGTFLDAFGFICPVLQTRIGGKRLSSETSSGAKEFEKL